MPAYPKSAQTRNRAMSIAQYKADTGPERELQERCEEYLKEQAVQYLHILTNDKTPKSLSGWPDIFLFQPDGKYNKCLMIELKSKRGKLHQSQRNRARRVNMRVVKSFVDFKQQVDEFLEEAER